MHEPFLLLELLLLIGIAAAGLALFERLKLPAIAGFLVVGALAGPGGLGIVREPERVQTLAELGVVFLLFEIGLELPLDRLRKLWRTGLLAGSAQIILTTGSVATCAVALGLSLPSGLVLGGILAMSSTALVMRLLSEQGQVDAPHGQLAIGILVLQDLSIVPFLLAVGLFSAGSSATELDLAFSLVKIVVALGVVLGVVRYLVPPLLDRAARLRSPDLFSMLALLVVLGSAYLAEELGLTLAVGAFLAGVAVSTSPYSNQLFSEVVPLRGVLLGIFFTAVGMLFAPAAITAYAPHVLGYVLVATLGKALLIALTCALLLGRGVRLGILTGLALGQTGEFSFVLAATATKAGLLDEWLHQVVIAGSILSLIATPFLAWVAPTLAEAIARGAERVARPIEEETLPAPSGDGRVVVLGMGPAGRTLTRLLRSLAIPYVVVDANPRAVEEARARGEPAFVGDATRPPVLDRLGVARAKLVAVAISDPLATRRIVSRMRAMAPDTPILARTRYVREVDTLSASGASIVVAEEFEGSIELVGRALALFGIPAGAIRNFTEALRDEGYEAIRTPDPLPFDPWLLELLAETGNEWVEVPVDFPGPLTFSELGVRAETGASIVAVERRGETTANPDADFAIVAGDRLLVLGDPATMTRLAQLLDDPRVRS